MSELYYFITTDGNLITGEEEADKGRPKLLDLCKEKGRDICHLFALYDEKCEIPYNKEENFKDAIIVLQHSYIIREIIKNLDLNGIKKLNCQTNDSNIPDILLFYGLGLNKLNFKFFKKYIIKSKYIFDWSRRLTKQEFNYRDKIEYYNFIKDRPSSQYIPSYKSVDTYINLFKNIELSDGGEAKYYLLKDITGSGGGNIYPIMKIKYEGRDLLIKIKEDDNIYFIESDEHISDDINNKYFLQEFKIPINVSGKDIIKHLLKLSNFDNPIFNNDIEDIFNILNTDDIGILCDNFNKLIDLLKLNHNLLNSFSYAFYLLIKKIHHSEEFDEIIKNINYDNVMKLLSDDNESIDGFVNICGYKDESSIILLKKHLEYYKFFNNEKLYMLKFRRPYLHYIKNNIPTITPYDRFDIDIIFDFNNDLSYNKDEYLKFKQFISNYTADNSIDLDYHIKEIHNYDRGVYELFSKIFTEEEQKSIFDAENIIYNDLKDSIQINEEYLIDGLNYSDKIYFKYYAIDYIIDENKKINILEVNDSAIIQKDMEDFVKLMINFIMKDKFKRDENIKQKYLKYKKKYLQLKSKLKKIEIN